ncbi:MAG: acyl-CoA dehydrogenase family protein [Acidimicrobiia bacterium]
MTAIDADDLAMLAAGFDGVLRDAADPDEAARGLFELGWDELLAASPAQAVAAAFGALGATGAAAGILDDVLAHALGLDPSIGTCIVAPAPGGSTPPGRRTGDRIVVDGTVTRRAGRAERIMVVVGDVPDDVEVVGIDASLVAVPDGDTIDPEDAHRRLRLELPAADATPVVATGRWGDAVAAARVALAHQLLGAARTMLAQAREHALDRVQFGRAIASFQAVRHKLADALVQIEGGAAVAGEWQPGTDPLLAALAKSLAGRAARTTATHAQQVLAGIGFTTDHPFHRWLKRTLVVDALFGSASTLPGEIGAELLARGGAPRLVEL